MQSHNISIEYLGAYNSNYLHVSENTSLHKELLLLHDLHPGGGGAAGDRRGVHQQASAVLLYGGARCVILGAV